MGHRAGTLVLGTVVRQTGRNGVETEVALQQRLNSQLSPSIHKFDDELIPSGLSAEGASGVEFTDLNT